MPGLWPLTAPLQPLTRIRRMAATISTRLLGLGTSRLPTYCRKEASTRWEEDSKGPQSQKVSRRTSSWAPYFAKEERAKGVSCSGMTPKVIKSPWTRKPCFLSHPALDQKWNRSQCPTEQPPKPERPVINLLPLSLGWGTLPGLIGKMAFRERSNERRYKSPTQIRFTYIKVPPSTKKWGIYAFFQWMALQWVNPECYTDLRHLTKFPIRGKEHSNYILFKNIIFCNNFLI